MVFEDHGMAFSMSELKLISYTYPDFHYVTSLNLASPGGKLGALTKLPKTASH